MRSCGCRGLLCPDGYGHRWVDLQGSSCGRWRGAGRGSGIGGSSSSSSRHQRRGGRMSAQRRRGGCRRRLLCCSRSRGRIGWGAGDGCDDGRSHAIGRGRNRFVQHGGLACAWARGRCAGRGGVRRRAVGGGGFGGERHGVGQRDAVAGRRQALRLAALRHVQGAVARRWWRGGAGSLGGCCRWRRCRLPCR